MATSASSTGRLTMAAAAAAVTPRGTTVCPALTAASRRDWSTAASMRSPLAGSAPRPAAILSAVRKPIPPISAAKRHGWARIISTAAAP